MGQHSDPSTIPSLGPVAGLRESLPETAPMGLDTLRAHEVFKARDQSFDTDRYLYHYTRWERLVEIAFSKTFRMSNLEKMNDPRESKAWYVGTMGHSGPPDLSDIDMSAVAQAIAKYKSMIRVAAFSQDVIHDDREPTHRGAGFARPTMWAHYAGNHTGCCIVFDKQRLLHRVLEESTHLFGSPVVGLFARGGTDAQCGG